ncbi:hypothetical protein A3D88_00825 [Candidatus Peribacteria bacterium RIFCSPHIGHO2_02_FULL_52_16]|nr:MAG: hypothetical protein A3D88_00825 [Candidatus Peribacteria bacterium RIFCSPHIGHO2_02_FULL_52_16]
MLELQLKHWPFIRFRSSSPSSEALGYIALATLVLSSSTYNSFGKQLTGALSPLSLLVLSEILTAFFVVLAFGVLPTLKKISNIDRKKILPLIILGTCNGVIAPFLFFIGLHNTTAVNAELFGRMEMVMLLVFAIAILREEHLTRTHVIAGSVMLCGILFVATKGFLQTFGLHSGDPFIFLSTSIFAGGSIVYKKFLHDLPPEIVIVCRAFVAVTAFLLLSPFIEHSLFEELQSFPLILIPALLGFGFISRFLNLFSFYEAIERIPVSTVSLLSTFNIIGGVLFASLYLGESIEWYHMIGGALIILGALLMELLGIHPSVKVQEQHMQQHHRQHL